MQGGKAGEDSHRKFNAGWKTGRPWLDFRKVTTTDHGQFCAGHSVISLEVTMTVSAGGPSFCFVVLLKSL